MELPWKYLPHGKEKLHNKRDCAIMKPRKCPRCELNYILDGAELCPVCRKAFNRSEPDDLENICIECGTNPALPGEDFCQACLNARRRRERENAVEETRDDEMNDMRAETGMEELEIEIPDEEIPETELAQIEDDLDYDEDDPDDPDDDYDTSDTWDE